MKNLALNCRLFQSVLTLVLFEAIFLKLLVAVSYLLPKPKESSWCSYLGQGQPFILLYFMWVQLQWLLLGVVLLLSVSLFYSHWCRVAFILVSQFSVQVIQLSFQVIKFSFQVFKLFSQAFHLSFHVFQLQPDLSFWIILSLLFSCLHCSF